jgi:flagellar biosynthetic protein FliP
VKRRAVLLSVIVLLLAAVPLMAQRAGIPLPSVSLGIGEATQPRQVALTLETLALITILTMAPAIVMMVTSFIRISIVFMFVSRALSTQQIPPNQIVMGLAIFLTIFVMAPTMKTINTEALQPYLQKKIDAGEFYRKGIEPVRQFMFKQTRPRDIALFMKLAKLERPRNRGDVPSYVLIPAFMISELKTAFQIGVYIFLPFVVIDLIVASILMSMGMIMLPPVMISLPLKLIVFILVDGWHLLTWTLVQSFH